MQIDLEQHLQKNVEKEKATIAVRMDADIIAAFQKKCEARKYKANHVLVAFIKEYIK
jgi:uncharacterized protein (DUF4415 family)